MWIPIYILKGFNLRYWSERRLKRLDWSILQYVFHCRCVEPAWTDHDDDDYDDINYNDNDDVDCDDIN